MFRLGIVRVRNTCRTLLFSIDTGNGGVMDDIGGKGVGWPSCFAVRSQDGRRELL
jgi:hypothetical protein